MLWGVGAEDAKACCSAAPPPGAGNQLPVVALDILHMLFAEDHVVLTKMNPVNEYYGPLLKRVRRSA
jgi:hypothetical protein